MRLASLALLAAGLVGSGGGATPANGAGYHLCDGYAGCAAKGMGNAGYAKVNHKMFWRMYTGHNCTNYAAYRMVQAGMPNVRPWSGGGNATYWGQYMSRITDQTPRVGAIAWYRNGGPGHVAYVEEVISRDEIIISQDSWGGDFSWARVTRSYGWPTGFIHFTDTTLDNTGKPTFNGATRVGATVRAVTPGAWKPAPTSVDYQWRLNGQAIPGATGTRLTLTPEMLGKRVSLSVSARRNGYNQATTGAVAIPKVRPGLLAQTEEPRLTGRAQVGRTLRVTQPAFSPAPTSVIYQWKVDGKRVDGATGTEFALGPYRAGRKVQLTYRATRPGYAAVQRTLSTTGGVGWADLTVTGTTRLRGTALPGETLRVEPGSVKQAATRTIQWYRAGEPVPGATGRTYQVTRRDLGARIGVRTVFQRRGFDTVSQGRTSDRVKAGVRVQTVKKRLRNGGVVFGLTVTSAGRPVTGGLIVRGMGEKLAHTRIEDGRARVRVSGLPRGWRTIRFVVPERALFVEKVVERRVWFR